MAFSNSAMKAVTILVLVCAYGAPAFALFCGQDNCYELLGVPRNSSKSEIRRAYRRLSSEMHPDKNPNDADAKENFRKIGAAYETLTDDGKRAKYEDFLDNPGKYWQYLMENAREVYAPKSNVFLVITGIIGIATLIHWLNMNHTYKETLRRSRESQEFKREVTRLVKSKLAPSREEAENMINLDIVGLETPDWRNLLIFKLLSLPGLCLKYILWNVKWVVSYKIRKVEFSDDDKVYLIKKNLSLSDEAWDAESESNKAKYLKDECWDAEKCEEFLRMKRIELNRLGKGKKKKRHTPVPYSETEELNMSE